MNTTTKDEISRFRLPVAELMLLLVAVFWGTSYGLTKDVLLQVSVVAFLAIRFFCTFCLLLPLYIKDYRKGLAKDWRFAIPTGLILLGIFLSETYGVLHTTASNAAFLISLCVLITPFVEWLVLSVLPSRRVVLFACVSLFGVFLLTYEQKFGLRINKGDAYILLAAFLRACMVVFTKVTMKNKTLSSICLTTLQSGVVGLGAMVLLIISTNTNEVVLPTTLSFWLTTAYLVVFCTIFAFFAQNYGVRRTSASKASLLMGTEPAFGAIFAMYWLGESFTQIQVVGGVLIVFSSIACSVQGKSE